MEKPREYTDQEVIGAWKLAFGDDPDQWEDNPYFYDGWESAQAWIEEGETIGQQLPNAVFGLALGILPEGWQESDEMSSSIYFIPNADRGPLDRLSNGCITTDEDIWFPDWPEAVRSGQAATACLLLAAHVELERRRKGVGNG